jgi:hypothetical protein
MVSEEAGGHAVLAKPAARARDKVVEAELEERKFGR